jgi:hypothetical protein
MGAYHGAEQPMLFGTFGDFRGPSSSRYEVAVSEALQDAWRAFANNPRRGLAGQHWARSTVEHDSVRWFGSNGSVGENVGGGLRYWEDQCVGPGIVTGMYESVSMGSEWEVQWHRRGARYGCMNSSNSRRRRDEKAGGCRGACASQSDSLSGHVRFIRTGTESMLHHFWVQCTTIFIWR